VDLAGSNEVIVSLARAPLMKSSGAVNRQTTNQEMTKMTGTRWGSLDGSGGLELQQLGIIGVYGCLW